MKNNIRAQAKQIVYQEMHPMMPKSRVIWNKYVEETINDLIEIEAETKELNETKKKFRLCAGTALSFALGLLFLSL